MRIEGCPRPAPGQHNDDVFRDLLGIPGPEIETLRAKKVIL